MRLRRLYPTWALWRLLASFSCLSSSKRQDPRLSHRGLSNTGRAFSPRASSDSPHCFRFSLTTPFSKYVAIIRQTDSRTCYNPGGLISEWTHRAIMLNEEERGWGGKESLVIRMIAFPFSLLKNRISSISPIPKDVWCSGCKYLNLKADLETKQQYSR